jgi:hypothetical protein
MSVNEVSDFEVRGRYNSTDRVTISTYRTGEYRIQAGEYGRIHQHDTGGAAATYKRPSALDIISGCFGWAALIVGEFFCGDLGLILIERLVSCCYDCGVADPYAPGCCCCYCPDSIAI